MHFLLFTVITGGLDSKLVMWDFSKGRAFKIVDFGTPFWTVAFCFYLKYRSNLLLNMPFFITGSPDPKSSSNSSQYLNPAFVHSIAVPEIDMLEKADKICAVARGDGVVDVIHIESEVASARSKTSAKPRKGSQSKLKDMASTKTANCSTQRLHLDYSMGGHTAAVSCV